MATSITGKLKNKKGVLLPNTWATFVCLSGATQEGDGLAIDTRERAKTSGAGVLTVDLAPGDYEVWANGEKQCQIAVPVSGDTEDILDLISVALSTADGIPTTGNAKQIWSRPIDDAAPVTGQALRWDGAAWIPAAGGGRQSIWLPAGAFTSRTTSGAAAGTLETATYKANWVMADFDASAVEYLQAIIGMPKSWDLGALKAKFFWTVAAGLGDVVWSAAAAPVSDLDGLDAARLAAATVTDSVVAAEDMHITAESGDIVCTGAALGDAVLLEVSRKATDGADTLPTDARLIGVLITYNTNSENDS